MQFTRLMKRRDSDNAGLQYQAGSVHEQDEQRGKGRKLKHDMRRVRDKLSEIKRTRRLPNIHAIYLLALCTK
jgi:hypothetical protein